MTNRCSDARSRPCHSPPALPPLPVIDWSKIGRHAPKVKDLGNPGKDEPLPSADIVVMTWTSTEWNALDHVFVSSDEKGYLSSEQFRDSWHLRTNGKEVKGAYDLWGYYKMVQITNADDTVLDVLLFKADAHLSHPPYGQGLVDMVTLIVGEAAPKRLYTIGTSGGADVSEKLGDTVVTNSGQLMIKSAVNKKVEIDGDSVELDGKSTACTTWFPCTDLFDKVQCELLYKLEEVVTSDYLSYMFSEAVYDDGHGEESWGKDFSVKDMLNDAMKDLTAPKGLNRKDTPLLSTDYYYIAGGDDAAKYCALEMDDTLIGLAAGALGADYVFVRNISDPIVPKETASGTAIPKEFREAWSSQIYTHFGFYTSMNGALLTWATIAAGTDST